MAGMEPLCQAPLILLLQPACMCRSRSDGGCTRANQPTFTALLQGRTSLLLLSSWPKAVRRPQPWQGIHPASRGRHRSFTGRRVRDPGWERGGQFTHMHVSCDVVTRWTTAVKRSEQLLATNVTVGRSQAPKSSRVQLHLYGVQPSQLRTASQVGWCHLLGAMRRVGMWRVSGCLWYSVSLSRSWLQ